MQGWCLEEKVQHFGKPTSQRGVKKIETSLGPEVRNLHVNIIFLKCLRALSSRFMSVLLAVASYLPYRHEQKEHSSAFVQFLEEHLTMTSVKYNTAAYQTAKSQSPTEQIITHRSEAGWSRSCRYFWNACQAVKKTIWRLSTEMTLSLANAQTLLYTVASRQLKECEALSIVCQEAKPRCKWQSDK